MGDRRTDAAHLKERKRAWPLAIRLARADDEQAVLGFATSTWDGWDYIPHAWPVWLAATDGVMLVAAPGAAPGGGGAAPGGGSAALDKEGQPLEIGRPIAVSRVAMVSPTEAWLEGIRVDPRVRGMDIATDMQVAELHWAAAQGATVVRYATSARNEASHRLGARHDFSLIAVFRGWWWSATASTDGDHEPSAFDPQVRAATTARREALLERLAAAGLVAAPDDAPNLWRRLSADPTFLAGQRLYEPRPWAMQEMTEELFAGHAQRGELLRRGLATAIFVREQLPAEDSSLRLALLAGDGKDAVTLLDETRRLAGESLRLRLPDDAPLLHGHEAALREAGFVSPEWALHILARPIDAEHPIPQPDRARLLIADTPRDSG